MELHRFFRYAIEKMCKEKKSLNHFKEKTSSYIRKSHKFSTSLAVLQYFPESTGVLPLQYCSTFVEVLDFMNSTDFMKE